VLRVCWMFFFFSSRRRHTRFSRDWSSDVCSSDLDERAGEAADRTGAGERLAEDLRERRGDAGDVGDEDVDRAEHVEDDHHGDERSEERRVGKECRSRWLTKQDKTNR